MTIVDPNPVRLTVASLSASNKVGVKIYDNGVCLSDDALMSRFVGLYQNGVEVGSISSDGKDILYNDTTVLRMFYQYGKTFALQLRSKNLPNGDYAAVISYTKDDETKNYLVPIQIEVPRATITKYPPELNRYELNRYELNLT